LMGFEGQLVVDDRPDFFNRLGRGVHMTKVNKSAFAKVRARMAGIKQAHGHFLAYCGLGIKR
jgi:hypothetical protein